jgi:hypothetical protein
MKYIQLLSKYLVIVILFTNCSASTSTRYSDDDDDNKKKNNKIEKNIIEDFDISPYKTTIVVENLTAGSKVVNDAWFEYDNFSDKTNVIDNRKIIGTVDGYRIMVLATDDMEQANLTRDTLSVQVKRHDVYISFEPPFYKVKVGDFTSLAETNNLKFKLNQLGYTEARIVQETVNLYEE